jgi:putative hemolysin
MAATRLPHCVTSGLQHSATTEMDTNALTILLFLICLGLSFLLSGMEAGVFALSRLRVRQQVRAGRKSAKALHSYLENPEDFLWTILVGNTVANFLILGLIIAWLHGGLGPRRLLFALIFLASVFLFYALFDLLPKMLFRQFPNRLCLLAASPFRFIHLALRPLVSLVEGFSQLILRWTGGRVFTGRLFGSREELRLMMQESGQVFTSEERMMINRVLDLQTLTAGQITTPLSQAVTVTMSMPIKDALALCQERNLTRLPVWETPARERIVGILNVNTLIYQPEPDVNKPVAEFVRPALYLDEDLRLETALQRLQRGGQRLAIVLGRNRKEIGIVSLQDILKVIFGEVSL